MRVFFHSFLIILFVTKVQAQIFEHTPLNLSFENPDSVDKRLNKYKASMESKYKTLFEEEYDKQRYIKRIIATNAGFFENGKLYYNWIDAESYLMEITREVIGNKIDSFTTVKIVRSPDDNAFMIEDGTIYVNVGLLANTNNEAELAATIGHEYGHYIAMHSYKSFMIEKKAQRQQQNPYAGSLLKLAMKSAAYSDWRELEKEADNTSLTLLAASKYNPYAFISDFEKYRIMQQKYEKSEGHKLSFFHDHPAESSRIQFAKTKLKGIDTTGRKNFVVSKEKFEKVKRLAIDESILLYLNRLEFSSVIELCYRELLLHPTDEFYLFYITEALRRNLVANPKQQDDYFITSQYNLASKKMLTKADMPVITSKKYGKLSAYDIRKQSYFLADQIIFYNDSFKMKDLPKSDLSMGDTLEFVSNIEALYYFMDVQKTLGYESGNFTKNIMNAQLSKDELSMNSSIEYLNKYKEVFDTYKKYNVSNDDNNTIGLIIYNLEANKGEYQMGSGVQASNVMDESFRHSMLVNFDRPNSFGIQQFMYDSIQRNDRNQFLSFAHAVYSNYTLQPKLKEISLTGGLNAENYFPNDPLQLAPEMLPLIASSGQRATVFMNLSIYYKPKSLLQMGADHGGIMTAVIIHILDYKKKRIIEKIVTVNTNDEINLKKDLLNLFPIIYSTLNN